MDFFEYPSSIISHEGTVFSLLRGGIGGEKRLRVRGDFSGFIGEANAARNAMICEISPENANALRDRLSWLKPAPLRLHTSAGMGDRLGLATPGHVAAVRGTGIAPIFAQQSVRENARTGRKPQEVMDDAMWGVFQSGWHESWGADADHLKRLEDLDAFVTAGYTFFTVDPGEYVDQSADAAGITELKIKADSLPWEQLNTNQPELIQALVGRTFPLDNFDISFDEEKVLRAAVKYGGAVAHANRMFRRLVELQGGRTFDFEVSVDETATPTSIHEHFYIAHELYRLGIRWTSLAPRFVGRFEKGVDFIGDLAELDRTMGQHAAIMRHFGSYKLSLHSGSDKFSVYPIAAKHAGQLVHLKTAGTSYLEALRVIAIADPDLFRRIYQFARMHYEADRASYHVSAILDRAPVDPTPDEFPVILDQFDARQVLHVTFGSVLDFFRSELLRVLKTNEVEYERVLARHFQRHLDPLKPQA